MMYRLVLATCSLAFIASMSAQNARSLLTGTVSDPSGAAVAEAPIQLKNKATGALARTVSKSDGRYTIPEPALDLLLSPRELLARGAALAGSVSSDSIE
jgi:hypothetical protein